MLFYQLGFLSSHFFAIFFNCCCYFSGILMSSPSVFFFFPLSFHLESLYPYPQNQSGLPRVSTAGLLILNLKQSSCLSLWSAEGLQACSSTPTLCSAGAWTQGFTEARRKLGSGFPPQLSAAQEGGMEETGKGCLWTFIALRYRETPETLFWREYQGYARKTIW